MSESLDIAIVLAVHNRLNFTKRCLSCLEKSSENHKLHIILIDDGSSDGTAEWIDRHHNEVTLLRGDGNLWFGGATQLGINHLLSSKKSYDYVLILNNDTFIYGKSLDFMVKASQGVNIVSSLLWEEDIGELGTSGFLWKKWRGLSGVSHPIECPRLKKQDDFIKVDSVSTTLSLFPTKYLVNLPNNICRFNPHHRYDVLLSAHCRKSGANFLMSTEILASHIYGAG
jgi:glycosyltransferase involved in cell wall biosynthesis